MYFSVSCRTLSSLDSYLSEGPTDIERRDGIVVKVSWRRVGSLHRIGGPARVYLYRGVFSEEWYENGELHRVGGPALIKSERGVMCIEEWHVRGELHRVDGPAKIRYYPSFDMYDIGWYQYGVRHREDGPADIRDGSKGKYRAETWYIRDVCQRVGGPAFVQYKNGEIVAELWKSGDMRHREDGPALICYNEGKVVKKEWYIHNKPGAVGFQKPARKAWQTYVQLCAHARQFIEKIGLVEQRGIVPIEDPEQGDVDLL